MKIAVKRQPNWIPPFSIEYDSKYILLFGCDKTKPYWFKFNDEMPDEFESEFLECVTEIRNANPEIDSFDDEIIWIETGINSVGTL